MVMRRRAPAAGFMANILLVEDDADIAGLVSGGLHEVGHQVHRSETGDAGLKLASSGDFDLLIVDRMLPDMDGLALVRSLREQHSTTPVLILSGLGHVNDRVEGLNCGGDDYLAKPFTFSELVARINALLRRASGDPAILRVGDLQMDLIKRKVTRAGRPVKLLPREFEMLEYLMRRADGLVTRTMLLEGVWHYRFDPKTNIVETHISRLRGKIGSDMIRTVRNGGYVMRAGRD